MKIFVNLEPGDPFETAHEALDAINEILLNHPRFKDWEVTPLPKPQKPQAQGTVSTFRQANNSSLIPRNDPIPNIEGLGHRGMGRNAGLLREITGRKAASTWDRDWFKEE